MRCVQDLGRTSASAWGLERFSGIVDLIGRAEMSADTILRNKWAFLLTVDCEKVLVMTLRPTVVGCKESDTSASVGISPDS